MTPSERVKIWRMKQKAKYIENYPDKFQLMPGEVFKDIPSYEGEYQVSNKGRIRSLKTRDGQIMRLKKSRSGYIHICLCTGNKKKHHSVHVLVLESFKNPRPDNHVVNHKDGNKENNDISNLEWVTQSANAIHSYYILGKSEHCNPPRSYGEDHPMATSKDVARSIKESYSKGLSSREVGRQFGVSKTTVLNIVNHKHWSNS